MSRTTIVFEGGIDSIRSLNDNSMRVSLGTPELSPEIVGNMYGMLKQPGYVVISTMPISQKQLDAVETATIDREFEIHCMYFGNKHNLRKFLLMDQCNM